MKNLKSANLTARTMQARINEIEMIDAVIDSFNSVSALLKFATEQKVSDVDFWNQVLRRKNVKEEIFNVGVEQDIQELKMNPESGSKELSHIIYARHMNFFLHSR
jgi:hypothetical protein